MSMSFFAAHIEGLKESGAGKVSNAAVAKGKVTNLAVRTIVVRRRHQDAL